METKRNFKSIFSKKSEQRKYLLGKYRVVASNSRNSREVEYIPINFEVFTSVRKDIYSKADNLICDIRSVKNARLWISGFHDFIMDGHMSAFSNDSDIVTFYQSAHYPHIEENERFCWVVNEFLLDY